MALLHILIGVATVAYCWYLYFTRTFSYWRDRNVSGPAPVPLFGNIKESALRRTSLQNVMKKIYDDFPHEKLVGVYRMTTPSLLVRDPDIVKQIMIKDFDYFVDRGIYFSKKGLGANLFHADEKTWRILGRKFTPLFSSGKLKNMFYLIEKKCDVFVKDVENLIQLQPEQEVYGLMQQFTMATIASVAFGLDLDVTDQSDTMDRLKKISQKMFILNYGFELDMMYPGILRKLGASVVTNEVTNFFNSLVSQVIEAREGKPSDRKDFMDLILEMRQAKVVHGSQRFDDEETSSLEITDDVIATQAFVFYSAGYETSASSMAYALYHLALNPDIQDRVVTEIEEVMNQHGDVVNYDALKDLVFLDRVFQETLRMHPQVTPYQRRVTADYNIPGTNVTLKEGQIVLVPVYGLHMDEKYWSDPSKFDPDRFSPEKSLERHSAVYLPFGLGPRSCIGLRFARMQAQLLLARLLQRFRLEATARTREELRFDPYRFIIFPAEGISVKFLLRK